MDCLSDLALLTGREIASLPLLFLSLKLRIGIFLWWHIFKDFKNLMFNASRIPFKLAI